MRKIDIIFIILCLFTSTNSYTKKDQSNHSFDFTTFQDLSVEESTLFIKQNALLIVTIPVLIFFHHEISKTMSEHPYISSICCYALINYICDAILDHQHQQSILHLIALIKKIALHLVISHGIKNYIHQKKQLLEPDIDEQNFFNTITANLPYSFNEITLITLKSYRELKTTLQQLNVSINVESEEFVFLCHASSINIHSLLYLTQNDPELHQMIYLFDKNPESEFKGLLQYLSSEITTDFLELEKNLLAHQMPPIQKQHPTL